MRNVPHEGRMRNGSCPRLSSGENPEEARYPDRVTRSTRIVKTKEIEDLDGNSPAVDQIAKSRFSKLGSSGRAKTLRDELFAAVATRYLPDFGELAGWYMNEATYAFVARYVGRHGCLAPEAPKTWPWRGIVIPDAATGAAIDCTGDIITAGP